VQGFCTIQLFKEVIISSPRHSKSLEAICFENVSHKHIQESIGGSICEEIPPNPEKLIQKVSQRNLLLFFRIINILKVSFILTIGKGSFSRWRPRWLPRAKILYIQGII